MNPRCHASLPLQQNASSSIEHLNALADLPVGDPHVHPYPATPLTSSPTKTPRSPTKNDPRGPPPNPSSSPTLCRLSVRTAASPLPLQATPHRPLTRGPHVPRPHFSASSPRNLPESTPGPVARRSPCPWWERLPPGRRQNGEPRHATTRPRRPRPPALPPAPSGQLPASASPRFPRVAKQSGGRDVRAACTALVWCCRGGMKPTRSPQFGSSRCWDRSGPCLDEILKFFS